MAASSENPENCLNCGTHLAGPFCAVCGQKNAPQNPSLHAFLHDLFHELVHLDGRILLSVRLLLRKPGLLSNEYFAGRRARYISPIRLYLIFSIAYFAIASFAPVDVEVTCPTCPAEETESVLLAMQDASHTLNAWTPRVMFVLVPVFAAMVALAARRSGRHYPHHLYFALHVHAAWFFAATLYALTGFLGSRAIREAASSAAFLYAGIYLVLALRRTYGLKLGAAVGRALVIGLAYVIVIAAAVGLIVFPLLPDEFGPGQ